MEYLQYYGKGNRIQVFTCWVLNLVISGIPSILEFKNVLREYFNSFKPCYKWNTFNTLIELIVVKAKDYVLNLVISGIPSILYQEEMQGYTDE